MCRLWVWMVVVVEVGATVGIRATLIQWVGGGRGGGVRVVGQVGVRGVGRLEHG